MKAGPIGESGEGAACNLQILLVLISQKENNGTCMNKASSLLSCEEQVKKTGQLPGAGYEAGAGRPPQKAVPGPWLCEGAAIAIPMRVRGCRHPRAGCYRRALGPGVWTGCHLSPAGSLPGPLTLAEHKILLYFGLHWQKNPGETAYTLKMQLPSAYPEESLVSGQTNCMCYGKTVTLAFSPEHWKNVFDFKAHTLTNSEGISYKETTQAVPAFHRSLCCFFF